jgi:Ulp1 family protease
LNVEIEKKINLTKGPKKKKIKRIRITLKKKTSHKLRLKDEVEKKSKFYNSAKNKNYKSSEEGPK